MKKLGGIYCTAFDLAGDFGLPPIERKYKSSNIHLGENKMFSPGNFKRNRLRLSKRQKTSRISLKKKRVRPTTIKASQKRQAKSLLKRRHFGLDLKPQPKKKRKGKGKSIAQFAVENAKDIQVNKDTGEVTFSKELSKRMGLKSKKSDGK